ncbi:MAG: ABC transporter ATP-binding protein/permease [Acholeplasmatales bacterium]|jgi:ATP-binding cassette subfamily B protein|nr:ABC transporter ATP-binding protein/permease [Acholeplasmatales bacterium]
MIQNSVNGKKEQSYSNAKPKNTRHTLKKLWRYISYYKFSFILGIILSIIGNVLGLIGPYITGKALGLLEGDFEIKKVLYLCLILAVFYVISAIFNYILSRIMAKISQKVTYKMRADLFNKLAIVPVKYFDNNQIGDIIARMSYDIDTVSVSLSTDFVSIFTSIFTIVISFVMMIVMSFYLSLIFFITIPLTVFITTKLSSIVRKRMRERNAALGNINGFSEEYISGVKTVQSYAREEKIIKEFDSINDNVAKLSSEAGYYSTIVGPVTNVTSNISVALVGIVGVLLLLHNLIIYGPLASFLLYSRRFSGPINNISTMYAEIQSAIAAAERVFSVIDTASESPDKISDTNLNEIDGNIEFKDVDFSYETDKKILYDITFGNTLKKKIAIVGPTGSGKTTIISLLLRFYDINKGVINLDNNNIYDIKRSSERKAFTLVLQDTWLFSGTILDNIRYGTSNASMETIIEVCKKAKIHNYIISLKDGYNTILTENGINISKGQRQLLIIARALLSDTKILVFDEATSNVDTGTEIEIGDAITELTKDKTSIIIAHRLSTIISADQIIVLKDGHIIETGTHNELINKKGFYQELFNSQFE